MKLGDSERLNRLDAKLRMVANGDEVVNTLRSERAQSVAVLDPGLLKRVPQLRGAQTQAQELYQLPGEIKKETLKPADSVAVSVFIELDREATGLPAPIAHRYRGARRTVRKDNLVTASVALNRLPELLRDPAVISVECAENVHLFPPLDVGRRSENPIPTWKRAGLDPTAEPEPRVLVGIIDVHGFDFAHPEFLDDDGDTRFVAIWDQGGNTRPGPRGLDYGSEITREHMRAALAASDEVGLPATELEPQSQMLPGSHGTHVAGIAAGNSGVCPEALIAGVLIALPQEDRDRRSSFYDSTRVAHAVDYLFALGEELGLPVSVNISLGTNGHAHDASSATSRWIDHALATAGRSVCVAAGNAGQEAPVGPGDWGFVMGRIHAGSKLDRDETPSSTLEWIVVGDGIADVSENELEIWYSPQDRLAVELRAPGSDEWIGPVEPGEYIENQPLDNGTFISVYNELYAPANGHNYIACYLSPYFSPEGIVGIASGTWKVRLTGLDVREGTYHAWIERDDPRRVGRAGVEQAWAFPSFFSKSTFVDRYSVSSLACGQRIVSVANLDPDQGRPHITSSQGPTRDERSKPDVAAPGTDITAANGFDPDSPWISMTGTSMASPFVAGVVARMLTLEPRLTAAQINGVLRRTAVPLEPEVFDWRDDTGFGQVDARACLDEVRALQRREAFDG